MTRVEHTERNHRIVRDFMHGYTIDQLAAHHGISRQRVSAIVRTAERKARGQAKPELGPLTEAQARDLAVRKELLRRFEAECGRSPGSVEEFRAWRVANYHRELALERDSSPFTP